MSDNTVPTDTTADDAANNTALSRQDPLRASDSERDTALHLLAAHYADGRLERAEFDERADAALAARTRDQLRVLFADLPGPRPVPALATATAMDTRQQAGAAAAYARGGRVVAPGAPPILRILVPLLLVFTVLGALHGAPPIPLIPLLFILTRRHRRWNREARPWT